MVSIIINNCEFQLEISSLGYSAIVAMADMEVSKSPQVFCSSFMSKEVNKLKPGEHLTISNDMSFTVNYE